MIIDATNKYYTQLNHEIKEVQDQDIIVKNVLGQRYIGTGVFNKNLEIHGTPGNALGAYLKDSKMTVFGNVQDAVGDTMDSGEIIVHGNAGDTLGYAMRGGVVYVKGYGGYRVGIHMKAYMERQPVLVIGKTTGSFLGEYQAGGKIIVLGLESDDFPTGRYCGTGMHGGAMYIRSKETPQYIAPQVVYKKCEKLEMDEIMPYLQKYSAFFDTNIDEILSVPFYKLTPSANNPYNSIYVENN